MATRADYTIPGENRISLDSNLENEIRDRFAQDRNNRFELFALSCGIRRQFLDAETGEYAKEFKDWYVSSKIDRLYGSLANFTKYAACGDVIEWVQNHTSNPEKYLEQLPVSMGALYEISQVLKMGGEILSLCLQFTASRKSLDEPKSEWTTKKPALIHPKTTEAVVRTWRRKWNNPPPPKLKRTDKRTLPFIIITCNGELLDFDRKTGEKIGCVDLNDVEDFLGEIRAIAERTNRSTQFRVESSIDDLSAGYYKRKEYYDPARNILTKDKKEPKKKYV